MKRYQKILLPAVVLFALFLVNSCSVGIPENAVAVQNFKADQYLGKWYEIARFDYKFERNMDNVTANYSYNSDGSIRVQNRGFNYVKKEWKESVGEARFVNSKDEARLKVSFFKPIWAGYNVIDIDDNYKYALVVGNNVDYMWILSRDKTIPETYKQRFLDKAKSLGFKTENLIWVKQDM